MLDLGSAFWLSRTMRFGRHSGDLGWTCKKDWSIVRSDLIIAWMFSSSSSLWATWPLYNLLDCQPRLDILVSCTAVLLYSTDVDSCELGRTSSRYPPAHRTKHHKISRSEALRLSRNLLKLIVAVVSFLAILAWLVWPTHTGRMASRPLFATQDHHMDKSMLVMTLNRTESTDPAVRVTVTNYHTSTTISLLKWNTPFDEPAVAQGVFSIWDHDTGSKIQAQKVKVDRILAPSKADFLELLPRHAVTKDVPIKATGITLKPGKNYDIRVIGRWNAIWHADASVAGEERLRLMGGPTGLINWNYESNIFLLHIWWNAKLEAPYSWRWSFENLCLLYFSACPAMIDLAGCAYRKFAKSVSRHLECSRTKKLPFRQTPNNNNQTPTSTFLHYIFGCELDFLYDTYCPVVSNSKAQSM